MIFGLLWTPIRFWTVEITVNSYTDWILTVVYGLPLKYFKPIYQKEHSVSYNKTTANSDMKYGLPQGSFLDPLFFSLYILSQITQSYEINFQV